MSQVCDTYAPYEKDDEVIMMMKKYKTNKCHKFVTRMRFINDGDDDNAGDE